MNRAIIYTRVSTSKQGISGLGLESQLDIATQYCKQNGLEVLDHYSEVQSGGKNDREMLAEALRRCELSNAKLVVAKLDRISRDVMFIAQLQKSRIQFVCADMPEANESMIQFMSVFAQYERKMASVRTKAALEALKKKGVKLGPPKSQMTPEKQDKARKVSAEVRIKKADDRAELVSSEIRRAKANGCSTYKQIAEYLNKRHITTPRGKDWYPSSVRNACLRAGI